MRSPEALTLAVVRLDVRNNVAFLPHVRAIPCRVGRAPDVYVKGQPLELIPVTMCNTGASALCAILGVHLPATLNANQQKTWLESEDAKREGWRACDMVDAIARANAGYPVIAVAQGALPPNETDESKRAHGHIGVGVPNAGDLNQLYVTAAGAANVTRAKIVDTFGPLAGKVALFTTN